VIRTRRQPGTNEHTNRLPRFWFEKVSNLSEHSADDLNGSPRPEPSARPD